MNWFCKKFGHKYPYDKLGYTCNSCGTSIGDYIPIKICIRCGHKR